ncbi:LAFE_0B09846g1_1 [Lachancea fermentati]|uniref:LAFE_0B09846g1_1 n=1 Tax=Lachancea fermentati TaxID=4955 RepID=A0A1G4M8L4_LACFM|nr:LAFE_0B09846g1_1 [Lachancea fermentati]
MGLIKKVLNWSNDSEYDYLSVNPTREEVAHYRVDPENEDDNSIVKMNTVKDFDSITCLDYSDIDVGLVGIGEKNGIVRLFNIVPDSSLSNNFNLRVRAKQQRTVNSIGISSNGLIAIGMERNRHDPSLQIWDINYQSTDSNVVNPSFSYCLNETLVSLKFLDDTTIITGTTKLLKEIDLRSPNPVYQHPTRLSYDIKINPFNCWQFTTYGDDGTLAIWDRRKLSTSPTSNEFLETQPLLKFEKLMGSGMATRRFSNACFRWSVLRSGEFTTLHAGQVIRRWRLGSVPQEENRSSDGEEQELSSKPHDVESLFVSAVHDINTTFDRVATFDYIPRVSGVTNFICMRQSGTIYRMSLDEGISKAAFNSNNDVLFSNNDRSYVEELRITNNDDSLEANHIAKEMKNLSFEDLDISEGELQFEIEESESISPQGDEDDSQLEDADDGASANREMSSSGNYSFLLKPEQLLQNDISMIMKRRALLGYGLDPMSTVELIDCSKSLQNNAYIRNTWRWLSIAKASVDDGTMVSGELDLGYEGILGIWNALDGLSKQDRYRQGTIFTEKQLNKELEKIIQMRGKNKSRGGNSNGLSTFANSNKPIQRKLCMIISGWDLTPADYEEKYQNLIKLNHYEKAAGWAVFFGDVTRAIEILSSAKKERLRLIATAIAGYLAYKDQPGNNAWRQQCRRMSSELADPYLRVIFGFIADNDWWDILYESAISLRERLGVALRFLNDKDLTRFLERTASTVIKNGELEGLILTGITPSGIDLLQSYVDKTSDVQTAALISVFGCPRYFKNSQVQEWVQTYRILLNSWGLFSIRAKFDVLRTRLSRTSQNVITAKTKPRQLYIQCLKCNKNINKPAEASLSSRARQNSMMKNFTGTKKFGITNNAASNPQQKHSCPHCGTPFPRCAICLLPLGTSNLPIVISGRAENYDGKPTNPEDAELQELREAKRLKLNEWFSFCLSCNHGMHAGHAEEWFEKHLICPVPGCFCNCNK